MGAKQSKTSPKELKTGPIYPCLPNICSLINTLTLTAKINFLMKAMILKKLCDLEENQTPLELINLPKPIPGENEIL